MKNAFISILNYFNLISALFLTSSLIYDYPYQKIAFYLFFSSYLIEVIVGKKWRNFCLDKKSIYYLIMIFFFLLAWMYFPFEHSSKYFSRLIEKRLPILGFAIVGLLGVNNKYKLQYFLNTFIISAIIAITYLIFIRIGITEFISNPLRNDIFARERILYVNSHMQFNFYLNISLICIWFIFTQFWTKLFLIIKCLYLIALTMIFSILSISEGRSGFIVGILLMLCFIFFEIWKRKKMIGLIIAITIPLLLVSIASQQRRMSKQNLESEPRIFLWESAVSVIKEKPLFGNGISDAQELFDVARTHYQTIEYRENWKDSKLLDSHNQYLQTSMEFGVIGLMILLFIYIFPIIIADKKKKALSILLLFLCAYQSVFDMFITGKFSPIFGILILLLLSVENKPGKNNEIIETF